MLFFKYRKPISLVKASHCEEEEKIESEDYWDWVVDGVLQKKRQISLGNLDKFIQIAKVVDSQFTP